MTRAIQRKKTKTAFERFLERFNSEFKLKGDNND